MIVLKYIIDGLFLVTLILLAFIPKSGKLLYLWMIFFIFNLGIRGYLIYRGHMLEAELGSVRELATRDIYRPLSSQLKGEIVLGLQQIRNRYRNLDVNLLITPEKGNRTRDEVAKELSSLFVEAGFQAKATGPVMTNLKGEVLIMLNPNDIEFANELYKVVGRFINTRFNGLEDENLPIGTLKIHIIADPLFSPDGIITFR